MVKIINNLDIDVIIGGVSNRTAEANVISMKGRYAYGGLYKELLYSNEIEQYIKDIGGIRK